MDLHRDVPADWWLDERGVAAANARRRWPCGVGDGPDRASLRSLGRHYGRVPHGRPSRAPRLQQPEAASAAVGCAVLHACAVAVSAVTRQADTPPQHHCWPHHGARYAVALDCSHFPATRRPMAARHISPTRLAQARLAMHGRGALCGGSCRSMGDPQHRGPSTVRHARHCSFRTSSTAWFSPS